jgi:hypothetical protein
VLFTAYKGLDDQHSLSPTVTLESGTTIESKKDTSKEMLHAIDTVVFQLYMAIGVNPRVVGDRIKPTSEAGRRLLFKELKDIFVNLTSAASRRVKVLAPQTVHHLVEIFASTVSFDPALVLQFMADLLKQFNWGYQFDSMAKDEMVEFVDALLADHKEILRVPANAINHYCPVISRTESAG